MLHKADPDVIIGHEFWGVSLNVLHHMEDLKVDHWSQIGCFQCSWGWPNIGKQGSNLKLLNGHVLCDLASDGLGAKVQVCIHLVYF